MYQPCLRATGFFICNIWTIISYEQQPHFNQMPRTGPQHQGQDPWANPQLQRPADYTKIFY